MADEADMTSDRMDAEEEFRRRQRAVEAPRLKPSGQCHHCEEPLRFAVFCDNECRDDWQVAEHARIRNKGNRR